MILKRIKIFSQILGTSGMPGFLRGRKYDQDLSRLGKMKTSHRELSKIGDLSKEIRKMNKELNDGRLGRWQHTD